MGKSEQAKESNLGRLNELANELDDLQKKENDGRGVVCVKDAVTCLRMGDLDSAKRICFHDHDKILDYPTLVEYIKSNFLIKAKNIRGLFGNGCKSMGHDKIINEKECQHTKVQRVCI